MGHAWQHFEHGADVGIRGSGDTLAEALAGAGEATTAAIADLATVRPTERVEISCSGADAEDLLYAWINCLVFEMATRHMLFARFDVSISDCHLDAVVWGETIDPARHEPAVEVKGATMTALRVARTGDRWLAECVIDV